MNLKPRNFYSDPATWLTRSHVAIALGISLEKLVWWIWVLEESRRYSQFELTQASGKTRLIQAPIKPIKDLQKRLKPILELQYLPPNQVHGYVQGRGILTNSALHSRKEWVLQSDLLDFFGHINFGRVRGMFMSYPFHCPEDVATLLAQLCCHQGKLPQGAPTSPVISNLICRRMDKELSNLARRERCHYSRYADDMVWSTDRRRFPVALAERDGEKVRLGDELERIIRTNGFVPNEDKSRLASRSQRQRVTGLTTNKSPNVPREYVRDLRNILYIWEKYGEKDGLVALQKRHSGENRPPGKNEPSLSMTIRGKVQYVGAIKGWRDPVYRRLAEQLTRLDPTFSPTASVDLSTKTTVQVFTEGESDVAHLSAALNHFHERGDYLNLNLEFQEPEKWGDKELLKRFNDAIRGEPGAPTLFLFDRDVSDILVKTKLVDRYFQDCGGGRACATLVSPKFRDDSVCIELLYGDDDLERKTEEGRRIYRRDEFDPENGRHQDGVLYVSNPKRQALICETVTDAVTGESVALSKSEFAIRVAERKLPFADIDFSGFRQTFESLIAGFESIKRRAQY